MKLTAIRLVNIRGFAGEHLLPIDERLTVLMGPNNAGKSTVLRAAFLMAPISRAGAEIGSYRRAGTEDSTVGLQLELNALEFDRHLGLAMTRLTDVHERGTQGAQTRRPLIFPPFWAWFERPHVEIGNRWGPEGGRYFRALSRDPATYVHVGQGKGVEYLREGGKVPVGGEASWFQSAWSTLGDGPGEGALLPAALLAHWEHDPADRGSRWVNILPSGAVFRPKRCFSADEARLQTSLEFLRLKHDDEFVAISEAFKRALPELGGLDFIEDGDGYRPGFKAPAFRGVPFGRESVGAGVWSFLCILAAARSAKATGARVLFLDEPHLHLHPGLERLLVEELIDPKKWDDEPLQIVMSTHSPTFVNAAAEQGTLHVLGWRDRAKGELEVKTLPPGVEMATLFEDTDDIANVLYAEQVVFVEGRSDAAAFRLLAKARCDLPAHVRFVPLLQTDGLKKELARAFSVVARSRGPGIHTKAILILDADKKVACQRFWTDLKPGEHPEHTDALAALWVGTENNDIESWFCDPAFLSAYFETRGVAATASRDVITARLAMVQAKGDTANKGCTAIRSMHAKLLGENDNDGTKLVDLEKLMAFYLKSPEAAHAATVRARLEPLEQALKALRGV